MVAKRTLFTCGLIFLAAWPLFSAVKQVRVIAEKASIYIEPNRTSSRIEIVSKGMILNLLQERKVKDIWYYISFNSPRYGTRISGFIQESAVELTAESLPAAPKAETTVPPEVKPERPRPAEAPPPPKTEEKKEVPAETPAVPRIVESMALTKLPKGKSFKFPRKETERQDGPWKVVEIIPVEKAAAEVEPAPAAPPRIEAKKEVPAEIPAAPRIVESMALTKLPKGKTYKFPRKELPLQESAWRIVEIAPVMTKKPPAEVLEFALLTVPPKRRAFTFPKKEKALDDPAWQVIQPVVAEMPKPEPPAVKKEPTEIKPESKPAEPQPIKAQQTRPVRRGPGFVSLGLGYGSSFGGAGGCLQLNTRAGLSFHAGAGLYPMSLIYSETDWVKNETLWSIGLKYYLPLKSRSLSPFVDIQYGGLRVEAAEVVIGIWDYNFIMSQEQKSLWGPSVLAGFELRMGRLGISAALGVSYSTTSWKYLQTRVSLVFDTGLVFHF